MKAVRYHSYGDSDVLVYEDADRPVAGPGQVVVQVAGTAFNPLDVAIRAGYVQQAFPITFPHIPGYDLAGVITEAGDEVTGWSAGDPVVTALAPAAPGAAAEYAIAPADALAAAPRALDLADAAGLPSVGLTAWQVLFEHAQLQRGQSLLVNGAGGAVGGYAVQLARQAGATRRPPPSWQVWSPTAEPWSARPSPFLKRPGVGSGWCRPSCVPTPSSSRAWSPGWMPVSSRSTWPGGGR
jgi:NADPH:quinone reductase-like Zn-dependent oxidoreductase